MGFTERSAGVTVDIVAPLVTNDHLRHLSKSFSRRKVMLVVKKTGRECDALIERCGSRKIALLHLMTGHLCVVILVVILHLLDLLNVLALCLT